ncbi:FAD dependent oxidoreductase [Purpureocillium lavendulum]|uniref:FAD dependent oxidoreductase n=1 Tax=Purpureocillium lavendulum TaxID=1247861 RepID=A0AB34FST4_9HYPO|nr:FAD dependent oxidoreductase [Purpureocillium lavendulum]
MSFAVRRLAANPSSSSGGGPSGPRPYLHQHHQQQQQSPPTTAPVLDFVCLFTHDLRRKQKRWQDGRLKYHTFNRRVMVYDERGNFIGDAHWPAGAGDLDEGEELELDRGAAIVQVAECAGVRDQDLSEVLDRRVRDVERRRAEREARTPPGRTPRASAAAAAASTASTAPRTVLNEQRHQQPQPHFQLNHRPLSAIVPSPGPIGRAAVPQESPFEARRRAEQGGAEEDPGGRGAKRRRVGMPSPPSKAGYAQSLFGTKLTLSGCPAGSGEAWARVRALRERTNLQDQSQDSQEKAQSAVRGTPNDEDGDVVMVEESRRQTGAMSTHFAASSLIKGASRGPEKVTATGASAEFAENSHQEPPPRQTLQPQIAPARPKTKRLLSNRAKRSPSPQREKVSSTPVDLTGDGDDSDIDTPVPREDARKRIKSKPVREEKSAPSVLPRSTTPKLQEAARSSNHSRPHDMNARAVSRPAGPPAPANEPRPRTELRIRSRQRRGLLMVAEKRHQTSRSNSSATPEPSSDGVRAECVRDAGDILQADAAPRRKQASIEATPEPEDQDAIPVADAEAAQDSGADLTGDASPANRPRDASAGPVFADSSSESDVPPMRRPQGKQLKPIATHEAASSDDDAPPVHRPQKRQPKPVKTHEEASSAESDEALENRSRTKATHATSGDVSDEAQSPPARRTRRRKSRTTDLSVDESDSAPSPPQARTRKSTRKKDSAANASNDKPAPSGPRITKMARKSIKSREIIGFVVSDDAVPAPFATATGRIGLGPTDHVRPGAAPAASTALEGAGSAGSADTSTAGAPAGFTRDVRNSTVEPPGRRQPSRSTEINVDLAPSTNDQPDFSITEKVVKEDAPVTTSDTIKQPALLRSCSDSVVVASATPSVAAIAATEPAKPAVTNPVSSIATEQTDAAIDTAATKARIANPATRGKKAARKEDAAGQAPQSLVPLEPPAIISVRPRVMTRTAANTSTEAEAKKIGGGGGGGGGGGMPGFSKANGGAWSRHAEDLLGMARPTGRR